MEEKYVILPKKDDKEKRLKGYEILLYVILRRKMDKDTMIEDELTIPDLISITELSKPTIIKLLNSIEEKGYIEKCKGLKDNKNAYRFSNEKHFEPFSYDFLDDNNLTKEEKLRYLCQQEYLIINNLSHDGKCTYSDREMHELSGLSYSLLKRTSKSLKEKGYTDSVSLKVKDPDTGLYKVETFWHLDEFKQQVVYAIRAVGHQTQQNTDDIVKLKKNQDELIKDIEILKRGLREKENEIQELRKQLSPNNEFNF